MAESFLPSCAKSTPVAERKNPTCDPIGSLRLRTTREFPFQSRTPSRTTRPFPFQGRSSSLTTREFSFRAASRLRRTQGFSFRAASRLRTGRAFPFQGRTPSRTARGFPFQQGGRPSQLGLFLSGARTAPPYRAGLSVRQPRRLRISRQHEGGAEPPQTPPRLFDTLWRSPFVVAPMRARPYDQPLSSEPKSLMSSTARVTMASKPGLRSLRGS